MIDWQPASGRGVRERLAVEPFYHDEWLALMLTDRVVQMDATAAPLLPAQRGLPAFRTAQIIARLSDDVAVTTPLPSAHPA